jgi:hypothetical protein
MKSIFINNNVTANASSGSLFAQEMRKNLSCSLSGALATAEIKHNPASTGHNCLIGVMAKVVPVNCLRRDSCNLARPFVSMNAVGDGCTPMRMFWRSPT